ncbi:MAG: AI-2E family transporter [Candidatus Parcubacteria bacterium]|nr:AI-2E family transporter [Candidatus Parcubacteria bacterium]
MQTKILEKYFFLVLLFATLIFTFFVFRPFWIVLVLGVSFGIVLYPIYKWLNTKFIPNHSLSSLLTVILFSIILCGPLLAVGTIVFKQSQNVYHLVIQNAGDRPIMTAINETVNKILPSEITFDVNQKATDFVSYVSRNIANIFSATLSTFFSFVLMLLIIFYFLKDGPKWKKALVKLSPLGNENDEKIINRLILSVNGVIKGSLFIALIQGALLGFGFWIFNIPNGALWGVVAAVMSLIPTFGTALVSIPAIIFLFITGNTAYAIGLSTWSLVLVGLVDNFLGPMVVGREINVPSIFILFSILGGISLLGPVGILIGPLTVSLLDALILICKNDFK